MFIGCYDSNEDSSCSSSDSDSEDLPLYKLKRRENPIMKKA